MNKMIVNSLFIPFIILIMIIVIVVTGYFIFDNYITYSQDQHFPFLVGDHKKSLKIELVTTGLSFPTSMAVIDKHNILVLEKNTGAVRLISDGVLRQKPILTLDVDGKGERGLLGLAILNNTSSAISEEDKKNEIRPSSHLHSTYPKAYVFLYFTKLRENGEPKNVLYRYDWNRNSLLNPKLISEFRSLAGLYHNGGKMTIGPRDRQLYVAIGDLNTPNTVTQNYKYGKTSTYSSVILRIDPMSGLPSAGNPFLHNRLADNNAEIAGLNYSYAYGIRNSFGLAFDPVTGYLWDTENGENNYDEINLVKPGFNSGWDKIMGPLSRNNNISTESKLLKLDGSRYSDPKFSWRIPIGVTAIEFLNSSILGKEYENNIFVGDINNGNIYYFQVNNEDRTRLSFYSDNNQYIGLEDLVADNKKEASEPLFATNFEGRITDIKTGPDGYLYILTYFDGMVYKIVANDNNQLW